MNVNLVFEASFRALCNQISSFLYSDYTAQNFLYQFIQINTFCNQICKINLLSPKLTSQMR